jgi:hypothetical protein
VLGAAIMEMFVADQDDRLRRLEQQAAISGEFRRSLANVRVWGDVRDEVAARVEAAAGARLPRPRGWTGRWAAIARYDWQREIDPLSRLCRGGDGR